MIGEEILRSFLSTILPKKAKVCQGFIEAKGHLSRQCDIIVYDNYNYAPIYSYGNIEVIPNDGVFAVIEVKANIDRKRFGEVLYAFKELTDEMGIIRKYLFLYEARKISTIESYFYGKYVPQYDRGAWPFLYDYDNYQNLPETIIGLTPNIYLSKELYQGYGRDMYGYVDYAVKDNSDKEISCLQKFIESLYNDIGIVQKENNTPPFLYDSQADDLREDEMKDMSINGGFGLFDL